jgi:hypothetical protein
MSHLQIEFGDFMSELLFSSRADRRAGDLLIVDLHSSGGAKNSKMGRKKYQTKAVRDPAVMQHGRRKMPKDQFDSACACSWENGGRYRIRTYDFHRVKMALYR